jgi:hypothetical protein
MERLARERPQTTAARKIPSAVNLTFIAADPSRYAELYVDGLALRADRDLNRRKRTGDPEIVVDPDDEKVTRERIVEIESSGGT